MSRDTFFIATFGCQMNVYDSGRIAGLLRGAGYEEAGDPAAAGVVIFNTCHIREKASEKIFSELGRLRGAPGVKIVAGCVAQAEEGLVRARAPFVDVVMGPQVYHRVLDFIAAARAKKPVVATDFPAESKFDFLPAPDRSGFSEFLTVQEGCDRFCTYCVVPYTRGAEESRPVADVLNEARKLADLGAVELTLLGQNVNAYHGDGRDLAHLIEEIAKIDGIKRIRYTTSHPADMTDSLSRAHRDVGKLMPFLHLPVQSGSDRILKAMNRRHTAAFYVDTIEKIRACRPDIAVSSDFIVGFPGETDADFEETMDLAKRVGFAGYFAFKFSARPGTVAADMDGQVPDAAKSERLTALLDVLRRQKRAFNRSFSGKTVPVLLDSATRGYSPWLQPVHVADGVAGTIVDVRITHASDNSLKGETA